MINKYYAVALIAAVAAFSMYGSQTVDVDAEFEDFVSLYRKSYFSQQEYTFRKNVFKTNLEKIEELNAADEATYGVNHMADWTEEEQNRLLGVDASLAKKTATNADDVYTATPIDWRTSGIVPAIKDQGSCGSCWAFAATTNIESVAAIQKMEHPHLSEQELVDCAGPQGMHGCNGGFMHGAYEYSTAHHGIEADSDYPYHAKDESCKAVESHNVQRYDEVSKYTDHNTCSAVAKALETAPVSVAVDASKWSFYKGGVFSNCGKNVNHAVLVVGTDADENWIVQNSWGARWGEKGYITLASGNTCAVCGYGEQPVL